MDLLEREAPLAELGACAAAAAEGAGRVVLLAGEAGIGKTSIVRELARGSPGFTLWWGACDALQTPEPLAPLHDIARNARTAFAPLLARHARGGALFGEIMGELQAAGPVLFVIEDAHWADESTLDLIRYVGRRIDRTQAVLIVTFRDDEVHAAHPLRSVIGHLPTATTRRITLSPLTEGGVATLAQRALRSPAGLHAATGGNPFFVTELLRHSSTEVPQTVQDLVLARYSRLPDKARSIVQLAAIVPARVERWLVQEVLRPAAADLEACLDMGLLLVDETHLFFRHELARVSVEKSMSRPVAESLHARAFAALVARGDAAIPAARLVHHAAHARDAEAVVRLAPAAARDAARRGAHREAAAHYRTALGFAGSLPTADRVALLEAYAVESRAIHRLADAIEARREMGLRLSGTDDVVARARNLSQLALDYVLALQNTEADAASRQAIALLEPLPASIDLANAYRVEAQLRMLNRDCRESVAWGSKALELGERFGDTAVRAATHSTVGAALLYIDPDSGKRHLERALQLALGNGLDYIAANAYNNLGSAAGELYRFGDADRYLHETIRFSTEKEIDFYRDYALAWLALCDVYLGRWKDAEAHALEALAGATEASTARVMALCAMSRLRLRTGAEGVEPLLDEAGRLAFGTGTLQRVAPVRAARAEAAHRRGDHAAVVAEARAALELAREHSHPWHVGELSYWLWREGQPGAPASECAAPWALQIAGRWREAAAEWARLGCPYEQARALVEGDDGARIEALAIFERLGAAPAAEDARRLLREAGVRGVPRGPRASTQHNPRGLTAREMEVLELLCRGQRNSEIAEKLFRSVRTIEHHVDSILGKLGARTRAEVVEIARREGLIASKMGSRSPENT